MADRVTEGALVRRKSDGQVGRIEWRRETESIDHNRFPIVGFKGVVHVPREFEVIEQEA